MADHEALKSKLERIKKLAENCIDDCTGNSKEYADDASYLYSVASSFLQKIGLDEDDKRKELEEE